MNSQTGVVYLMVFYGIFLITCGIVSVIFIGSKARTALMSGGISGIISLLISYAVLQQITGSYQVGLILSFALFLVFSWRSSKTLFRLFEMIPVCHEELKVKGIAFLIISLMAVVSLTVFILQIYSYQR